MRARLALGLALLATGCTHLVWYGSSPNRRHLAAVLETGAQQRVRLDMVDGRPFRGIAVDALVLTDDGHLAYPAQTDEGWAVVLDGVAGPSFDAIGELVFAHGVLSYAAEQRGAWTVVTRSPAEARGPPFTGILARSLTVSPAGRIAYAAQRDRDTFVVIDGIEHGPFEGAGLIRFSADGARVGFTARTAGATTVHLEGRRFGPFETVSELHLGPPDAFIATVDREARVYVDGQPSEPSTRAAGLLVKGPAAAWVERRGAQAWVIDGTRRRGPFRAVTSALQRDTRGRLVFSAMNPDDTAQVFVGDTQSEPFREVSTPLVAGEHVGFIVTGPHALEAPSRDGGPRPQEGAWVVLDGRPGPRWAWADALALSPDGTRFAHLASRGGPALLVVDGVEQPVDTVVSGTLAFSRDGQRFGCVVGDRKTRRLVVQRDDGRRVPVDLEEVVAALSRQPGGEALLAPDAELLRRWVEAELER